MHRYGEHINGYQRGWGLEGKVGKEGQLYGEGSQKIQTFSYKVKSPECNVQHGITVNNTVLHT